MLFCESTGPRAPSFLISLLSFSILGTALRRKVKASEKKIFTIQLVKIFQIRALRPGFFVFQLSFFKNPGLYVRATAFFTIGMVKSGRNRL